VRTFGFLVTSLFVMLISLQSVAAKPGQDNRVELSVVKYDGHVQVECRPANADTSTRGDWKKICNDMAAPQVQKLAEEGTIDPVSGPVFDKSAGDLTEARILSRSIALSRQHL